MNSPSPAGLLVSADVHQDARGHLFVVSSDSLPFLPRRVFWIRDVPPGTERGGHAHTSCAEIVFAATGSVEISVDDGRGVRQVFVLNNPGVGLYIGPNVWCELRHFTSDAVCLVLASEDYDSRGYIHDYDAFRLHADEIR